MYPTNSGCGQKLPTEHDTDRDFEPPSTTQLIQNPRVVPVCTYAGSYLCITPCMTRFQWLPLVLPSSPPVELHQEGFLSQNFSTQHRPVTASTVQSGELQVIGMFRRPSGWAYVLEKKNGNAEISREKDHCTACSFISPYLGWVLS